ncbi:MAG: type II toxin-antitoxin system HicB family antitoxin [Verrucomicrobia bacterium]|jgi:predicted RNase H-like HicB family nuclease|nr:type II toxin-antitoxin system HicB family antitoxin [Verrucomicrobiota bacterium]
MKIKVETEEGGRFIAVIPAVPGAMAYGETAKEAVAKVETLVLRMLARISKHTGLKPSDM